MRADRLVAAPTSSGLSATKAQALELLAASRRLGAMIQVAEPPSVRPSWRGSAPS